MKNKDVPRKTLYRGRLAYIIMPHTMCACACARAPLQELQAQQERLTAESTAQARQVEADLARLEAEQQELEAGQAQLAADRDELQRGQQQLRADAKVTAAHVICGTRCLHACGPWASGKAACWWGG
jgi:hypothetical protein